MKDFVELKMIMGGESLAHRIADDIDQEVAKIKQKITHEIDEIQDRVEDGKERIEKKAHETWVNVICSRNFILGASTALAGCATLYYFRHAVRERFGLK